MKTKTTTALTILAIMALTRVANAQNEFGLGAGNDTMAGANNTAAGSSALFFNLGSYNTAFGANTLFSNENGYGNTANGAGALGGNTEGSFNTASGYYALFTNRTGNNNTAYGVDALTQNYTGVNNTGVGVYALGSNLYGTNNIAVGFYAGYNILGDNNITIGSYGEFADNNTIRIGTVGTHTNTFIAGISGVTVPNAASPVVVDSVSGQLGTVDMSTLKGADGTNGVNGIGFVSGAYLYLPATASAPDGFTKIGTKTDLITDLHGHMKTLKMNVYQKN